MPRTLLLFGAGPGIGTHVAAQFAARGISHVVLLARNAPRLESEDARFIASRFPRVKVSTVRIDLAALASIPSVLEKLDVLTKGEDVEVVYFNAARVKPSDSALSVSVQEIEEDFRTTNLALYAIAQHYIPRLVSLAKSSDSASPALLVTNSALPWDPVPQLLSLSLVKASQKNMVESFQREFSASGVHIGLIFVEGAVAPANSNLNPRNIAEKTVEFWERGTGAAVHIKE
ncbi:hypothetical protein ACN47E_003311 [Coniothyrium glycines]